MTVAAKIAKKTSLDNVRLTPDNHVYLVGEIANALITKEIYDTSAKLADDDILFLVIESGGGSVMAASDIVTALEDIPQEVHTISIYAASAAFYIAQHGVKRYIVRDGIMMQHRENAGVQGNTDNMQALLDALKAMMLSMNVFEADRLGLSLTEYKAKIENDWWLFGKEAVKNNAVDERITISCSEELRNMEKKIKAWTLFGPIETTIRACPLIKE